MLLQPHNEPITREVTGHHEEVRVGDVQASTMWDKLVSEFHDIFDPSSMPVEQDAMYQIELLPNAEPHYIRWYTMSAVESAEVRRQLDEYLAKGWIKSSCSPWGAAIVFIKKKAVELRTTVDYRAPNR